VKYSNVILPVYCWQTRTFSAIVAANEAADTFGGAYENNF